MALADSMPQGPTSVLLGVQDFDSKLESTPLKSDMGGRTSNERPQATALEEVRIEMGTVGGLGRKLPPEPANPLWYRRPKPVYEFIKRFLGFFLILPIHVIVLFTFLPFSNICSNLSVLGLSEEDLKTPLTSWRRFLQYIGIQLPCRVYLWCIGFHWITIKGKCAPKSEAPLIVANHCGFSDILMIYHYIWATGLARKEAAEVAPWLGVGGMVRSCQSMLVDRTAPAEEVTEELKRRAASPEFRQVLVFPEGTTTNGQVLGQFKRGAFVPGLPVQPICIRYPFHSFDPTWVPTGPQQWTIFLYMLCQFHIPMEVEYLPVYVPSEEEKRNPILYANNVKKVMAQAMGVPVSEHTFDDVLMVREAKSAKIPLEQCNLEMGRLGMDYKLKRDEVKTMIQRYGRHGGARVGRMNVEQFAESLGFKCSNQTTTRMFESITTGEFMTLREYVVGLAVLGSRCTEEQIMKKVWTAIAGKKKSIGLDDIEAFVNKNSDSGEPDAAGVIWDALSIVDGVGSHATLSQDLFIERVKACPRDAAYLAWTTP